MRFKWFLKSICLAKHGSLAEASPLIQLKTSHMIVFAADITTTASIARWYWRLAMSIAARNRHYQTKVDRQLVTRADISCRLLAKLANVANFCQHSPVQSSFWHVLPKAARTWLASWGHDRQLMSELDKLRPNVASMFRLQVMFFEFSWQDAPKSEQVGCMTTLSGRFSDAAT